MNELERMYARIAPPAEEAVAEGRRRVLAATRSVPARRRRRPAGRRIVVVPAGLAVALMTGVIVVQRTGDGRPAPPLPIKNVSAVELLHRAAVAARSEPELRLRDDQYLYVKSITAWGPGVFRPGRPKGSSTREVWVSVDGSKPGILRTAPCSSNPPRTCDTPLVDEDAPAAQRNPGYKWELQRVPALLRMVRTRLAHPNPHPTEPPGKLDWEVISDLLGENYLPPELRAEVFLLLAEIPGTKVTENATDALGRSGVAVSKTEYDVRMDFVFDPTTYRFLGSTKMYLGPQPHITDWRRRPPGSNFDMAGSILETKAVNHPPATHLRRS